MFLRAEATKVTLMTETFVSTIAMIVALLAAFGSAIFITAAFIAWQDWQREKASLNCEADRSHRFDGLGRRLKPRF
jgi:NADH:ubiquinone oxidoreductase subunit 5 (subunit L)/multisubunit Na+/H+ antiporter MnhA subunit